MKTTPLTKGEWQVIVDLVSAFEAVDSHAAHCECEECEARQTVLNHRSDDFDGVYMKAVENIKEMTKLPLTP